MVGVIVMTGVLIYELVELQDKIQPLTTIAEDINALTSLVKK